MTEYDLGKVTFVNHESETLTGAFGIPEDRWDPILAIAKEAWEYEDTVSESVEYLVKKLNGSELVLGLLLLGRLWEKSKVSRAAPESEGPSSDAEEGFDDKTMPG